MDEKHPVATHLTPTPQHQRWRLSPWLYRSAPLCFPHHAFVCQLDWCILCVFHCCFTCTHLFPLLPICLLILPVTSTSKLSHHLCSRASLSIDFALTVPDNLGVCFTCLCISCLSVLSVCMCLWQPLCMLDFLFVILFLSPFTFLISSCQLFLNLKDILYVVTVKEVL